MDGGKSFGMNGSAPEAVSRDEEGVRLALKDDPDMAGLLAISKIRENVKYEG
jgi:hypothetical protein